MVKRLLHVHVWVWLPYLELGWQARQDVSEETQPPKISGANTKILLQSIYRERDLQKGLSYVCWHRNQRHSFLLTFPMLAATHSRKTHGLRAGTLLKCCWITGLPSHSRMKYPEWQLFCFQTWRRNWSWAHWYQIPIDYRKNIGPGLPYGNLTQVLVLSINID